MSNKKMKIHRRFPLPLSIRTTNGEWNIRHIGYAGGRDRFYLCTQKHIVFFDLDGGTIESTYCSMGVAADDSTIFSVATECNYKEDYRYLKIGLIDGNRGKLKEEPIPWEIRVEKNFAMYLIDRFNKLMITTEHGIHLMDHRGGSWQDHLFVPLSAYLYDYTLLDNHLFGLFHQSGLLYGLRGTKGGMKMLIYSIEKMAQTDELFIESREGLITKTEMVHDHNCIIMQKEIEGETHLQFYDHINSTPLFTSPKPVTNHAFHLSDRFFILAYADNSLELFSYPQFESLGYTDIFSFSPSPKIFFGTGRPEQTVLAVTDDEAIEFRW